MQKKMKYKIFIPETSSSCMVPKYEDHWNPLSIQMTGGGQKKEKENWI